MTDDTLIKALRCEEIDTDNVRFTLERGKVEDRSALGGRWPAQSRPGRAGEITSEFTNEQPITAIIITG
jgi:hypothetical protein